MNQEFVLKQSATNFSLSGQRNHLIIIGRSLLLIIHQVNIELLVMSSAGKRCITLSDSMFGTDSHTTRSMVAVFWVGVVIEAGGCHVR